jgi:predicted RNase H-like HicB family nuclease
MIYHFKIHKEKKGFWAQCIELPGCVTQGDSLKELRTNMQDALNLYIEEPNNSDDLAELPSQSLTRSKNIESVVVDPLIAFAFLVR